ncbi:hypothetical protein ACFRNJ_12350 [Streptomyces sp. NPDC056721]|uniref:hypothetical protein n=1 Tax=Streptomyces sp. NPDC056721 TaxID=3345923 RepID=UPI0036BF5B76
MSTTARQSVKAYRSQRARFADPAYVTRRRAGAAFPVPQGAPAVLAFVIAARGHRPGAVWPLADNG